MPTVRLKKQEGLCSFDSSAALSLVGERSVCPFGEANVLGMRAK